MFSFRFFYILTFIYCESVICLVVFTSVEAFVYRIQKIFFRVGHVFPEHNPGQSVFTYVGAFFHYRAFIVVSDENPLRSIEQIWCAGSAVPEFFKAFLVFEAVLYACKAPSAYTRLCHHGICKTGLSPFFEGESAGGESYSYDQFVCRHSCFEKCLYSRIPAVLTCE